MTRISKKLMRPRLLLGNNFNHTAALGSATALILVGIFVVIRLLAANLTSLEVESGSRSGGSLVSDSSASNNQYFKFGAVITPPPPPVVTPPPPPPPAASGPLQPVSLGFAPFAYIPWGNVTMDTVRASTGVTNFVAAFIQSAGGCTPAWDGDGSLGLQSSRSSAIATDITNVRSHGGDVTVSFGGAAGTELAVDCGSTAALKAAYKSVIDRYSLTRLDFDIEGSIVSNSGANLRRAQALQQLQGEYPNLKIWLTLAVEPSGLSGQGVGLVKQMTDTGAHLAGVNLMIMDYGTNTSNMANAGIQAAQSTFSQLKGQYGSVADATIWKTIGLIPMIGINDTAPETFTLANAATLRSFAGTQKIGMLSMWSANRDKSCPGNAATVSDTCSGISQSPNQFMTTLNMPPN